MVRKGLTDQAVELELALKEKRTVIYHIAVFQSVVDHTQTT